MTDKNCAQNINLVGLNNLSKIAKQLPIPRQDQNEKKCHKFEIDSNSVLDKDDAELVSEITGARYFY